MPFMPRSGIANSNFLWFQDVLQILFIVPLLMVVYKQWIL